LRPANQPPNWRTAPPLLERHNDPLRNLDRVMNLVIDVNPLLLGGFPEDAHQLRQLRRASRRRDAWTPVPCQLERDAITIPAPVHAVLDVDLLELVQLVFAMHNAEVMAFGHDQRKPSLYRHPKSFQSRSELGLRLQCFTPV